MSIYTGGSCQHPIRFPYKSSGYACMPMTNLQQTCSLCCCGSTKAESLHRGAKAMGSIVCKSPPATTAYLHLELRAAKKS